MADAYGFVPIEKFEKTKDGTLIVRGPASDSSLDNDKQIADPRWLGKSMPKWFVEGGNVREQHDGKRAAGVALTYEKRDGDIHWVEAEVVDPVSILKVEKRVLRGFSFGARNARVVVDKAAPGGRIVDGDIFEVSLVDRPANPNCMFTVAKADSSGDLQPVEEPELVETEPTEDTTKADEPTLTPTQFAELLKGLGKNTADHPMYGEGLTKAVKQAERDKMADSGVAMPNGDFPIPDAGHLTSAIGRLGNYDGDKAAAKKHIIKRARALGLIDKLPDDWNVSKAEQIATDLRALVPGALVKADGDVFSPDTEASDVDNGTSAIAAIARLIISEAEGLAAGRMEELWDIQLLIQAAQALECFVGNENYQEAELAMSEPTKADAPTTTVQQPASEPSAETPTTEAEPATAASKTEGADPGGLTKTDLSVLLDGAIAKAVQPYRDELELVKADMAKVLETPRPDGPARMRTTTQKAVASKADALHAEIRLCTDRIATTSGDLKKGYRERLAAAEEVLAELDGAA